MPSMLWCSATQKRVKPSRSTCCASASELRRASAGVPSSRTGARSRVEKRTLSSADISCTLCEVTEGRPRGTPDDAGAATRGGKVSAYQLRGSAGGAALLAGAGQQGALLVVEARPGTEADRPADQPVARAGAKFGVFEGQPAVALQA